MSSEIPERVLKRVRAMLRKTVENGATHEEAATAAAQAQAILDEYNMSVLQIEIDSDELPDEMPSMREFQATKIFVWRGYLITGCALAYGCRATVAPGRGYQIYGFERDMRCAVELYNHLAEVVQTMTRNAKRERASRGLDWQKGLTRWGNGYRRGLSFELCGRLKELGELRQKGASAGVGLVLRDRRAKVDELFGKYNTGKLRTSDTDMHGMRAGAADAGAVPLGGGMEAGKEPAGRLGR